MASYAAQPREQREETSAQTSLLAAQRKRLVEMIVRNESLRRAKPR